MIHIIYMAAGNSRRFGSNKLLWKLQDKPLYRYGLETLLPLFTVRQFEGELTLTLVSQYPELLQDAQGLIEGTEAEYSYAGLYSPLSEKGVSYTIRTALMYLQDAWGLTSEGPDLLMFVVADQPMMRTETLIRLIERAREADAQDVEKKDIKEKNIQKRRIVSLAYQGKPGNPCIFPAEELPELMALEGDQGGRKLIRRREAEGESIIYVEAGAPEEMIDIDRDGTFTPYVCS